MEELPHTEIAVGLTQGVWLVPQRGQQLVQWQQVGSAEQRQGWCISAKWKKTSYKQCTILKLSKWNSKTRFKICPDLVCRT